jgi:hypothetical protein
MGVALTESLSLGQRRMCGADRGAAAFETIVKGRWVLRY